MPPVEEPAKPPAAETIPTAAPAPLQPGIVSSAAPPSMSPPASAPWGTPSRSREAVQKKADSSMNPPLEMGPLTLGGILDRTFTICRNHFWKLLAIMIVPWVITVGILAAAAAISG